MTTNNMMLLINITKWQQFAQGAVFLCAKIKFITLKNNNLKTSRNNAEKIIRMYLLFAQQSVGTW